MVVLHTLKLVEYFQSDWEQQTGYDEKHAFYGLCKNIIIQLCYF